MQQSYPFQPSGATGETPTAQAALVISASVQQLNLPATASDDNTMQVSVDGAASVAWSYGVSASLTLSNGCFVAANTTRVFLLPPRVTQLSVIGASAVGTLRVVVGQGGA